MTAPPRPAAAAPPTIASDRNAPRLHCHDFPPQEIDALRCLLRLLGDYLRAPWQIAADSPAVVFVNLDDRQSEPDYRGARLIGCACRPRLHPPGTLHRPFRAGEILAVLSESPIHGVASAEDPDVWRYQLRAWPAELEPWPRTAVKVMAAISRQRCAAADIAAQTGVSRREVDGTLAQLKQLELVDRLVERRAQPRAAAGTNAGLRNLAARVGRMLGFAR